MRFRLGCVVEGKGDAEALPVLLRRMVSAIAPLDTADVVHPVRIPKTRLLRPGEIERAVRLASLNAGPAGAVIVLLDSDDDCPRELGPALLRRADAQTRAPVLVALANREFEGWFLAAAESLRGKRRLPVDLNCPEDPEAIRGAKEWLSARMSGGHYVETLDQPALASFFDLTLARRARSFARFYDKFARLIEELRSGA